MHKTATNGRWHERKDTAMTENKRLSQAIREVFGNAPDEQVAEALGVSVNDLNADVLEWNGTTLAKLSNAAHVSVEWLMGRTDERVPETTRNYYDEYVQLEDAVIKSGDMLAVAKTAIHRVADRMGSSDYEATDEDVRALYGAMYVIEVVVSSLSQAIE